MFGFVDNLKPLQQQQQQPRIKKLPLLFMKWLIQIEMNNTNNHIEWINVRYIYSSVNSFDTG